MNKILLNDLLRLSEDDIKSGRFTFNTGNSYEQYVARTNREDYEGCDFSFWAFNSSKTRPKQHLREGWLVITFVQLPESNKKWLLTSICRITKFNANIPCERMPLEEYRKYFGRIIIEMGKRAQGYNFKIKSFLEKCAISEILPKPYSGKPFPGYDNVVNIKMQELITYVSKTSMGNDWKKSLSCIKAIYCLNNQDEHKIYIGSAYGDNGCLFKRWNDYFNSFHGGNVKLKELFKNHNDEYFLNNIYFSILETFPVATTNDKILEREHHWMKVFNSHDEKCGYNKN